MQLDVLTVSDIYWSMGRYQANNQEGAGEPGLFSPVCSSIRSAVARTDAD